MIYKYKQKTARQKKGGENSLEDPKGVTVYRTKCIRGRVAMDKLTRFRILLF